MGKYIMALDQGTTSSRCILFNEAGEICSVAQKEFTQIYPQPGWVEHNPMEIWSSQLSVATEAMAAHGVSAAVIGAIGITNLRETTIVWDKRTGEPVYHAIVWQCRRTAYMLDELMKGDFPDYIREHTGLQPDAYFSASKLKWILDEVPGVRERAERGELLFGTVDTWLIWNLTKGKVFVTDYTNASRTMLFDIHSLTWDDTMLERLQIPKCMLPEVKPSSTIYGYTDESVLGGEIPIAGAAGDQQAALFGQCCFEKGEVKNTYGTGCFLLMNIGSKPILSRNGLVTTIAASRPGERIYALEGSVFVAGAAIQWLRDEMRMIRTAAQSEEYARSVPDTGGVYIVPAFTGLGAPHWDQYARGTMVGITRGTQKEHVIRATLEAIAYQTVDVLKAMEQDLELTLSGLKVDGGASANHFLMQFQSDILGIPVEKPTCIETTALGAAYLAGLAVGYWSDEEALKKNWKQAREYQPDMNTEQRERLLRNWRRAVERAKAWEE